MSEIVQVDPKHTARLADLHGDAFASGWSRAEFLSHIGNDFDNVLVRMDKDQVVGFVVTRTQADQSEILTIVVARDYQSKGIGADLLEAAEACSIKRGSDIMFLDVAADNAPAQALYRRAGYTRYGTRKGYYRRTKGRVDAHLFQKRL